MEKTLKTKVAVEARPLGREAGGLSVLPTASVVVSMHDHRAYPKKKQQKKTKERAKKMKLTMRKRTARRRQERERAADPGAGYKTARGVNQRFERTKTVKTLTLRMILRQDLVR